MILVKFPLARSRKNNENSTMQLGVDEQGLFIRVYLDIESNTEARNLYSAIQRGDITGMSFMFSIEDEAWEGLDTDKPTHRIEIFLVFVEVSAVTFPAYEDTNICTVIKAIWRDCVAGMENSKHHGKDLERSKKLSLEARMLLKFMEVIRK